MDHEHDLEPRSSEGHQTGRESQHGAVNGSPSGVERGESQEAVHGNGVESHRTVLEQRSDEDHEEERIVALVQQTFRQEVTQLYFSEQPQLHSPDALEGYKRVDPSIPGRILAMAEREQKAQIDADLLPIRAEAYAYRFAVTVLTLVPTLLIVIGIILVLTGNDTAGYMAGVIGVIGGGAQIISQVRPSRQGRSFDAGERTAKHRKPQQK